MRVQIRSHQGVTWFARPSSLAARPAIVSHTSTITRARAGDLVVTNCGITSITRSLFLAMQWTRANGPRGVRWHQRAEGAPGWGAVPPWREANWVAPAGQAYDEWQPAKPRRGRSRQAVERRQERQREKPEVVAAIQQSRARAPLLETPKVKPPSPQKAAGMQGGSRQWPHWADSTRKFTEGEIDMKRQAARGIKDLSKLIATAEDCEDKQILEECRDRLRARAKGAMDPSQRVHTAVEGLADAQIRLRKAAKHLAEANELYDRAQAANAVAQQELEEAEQAEAAAAERQSSPSRASSQPSSAGVMQAQQILQWLRNGIATASTDSEGNVAVSCELMSQAIDQLAGLISPPLVAAAPATPTGGRGVSGCTTHDMTLGDSQEGSDMGFTDDQIREGLAANPPPRRRAKRKVVKKARKVLL